MKKIIFILILLIISIKDVSASSYSDWININEENSKIEIMKKYRFYKEEKEGIYLPWNSHDSNYPYVDENDYYYQESTNEWQEKCQDNGIDQIVRKSFQGYKPLVDTPYLQIIPLENTLNIEDIEIRNQDELITYTYLSGNNQQELIVNKDNNIRLKINIPKYSISTLTFNIKNKSREEIPLRISLFENSKYNVPIIITYHNSNQIFTIKEEDITYFKNESAYQYIDQILPKNKFYNPEIVVSRCRINQRYNYHYQINKVYLDGYYHEKEGYLKDETNYQTYIRYQIEEPIIKDKVIYQDKIIYQDKLIYQDKISYIEKPVYYEKLTYVEKPIYLDKPVYLEKLVYQDQTDIEEPIKEEKTTKSNHISTKINILSILSVVGIIAIVILIYIRKMSIK